VAASTVAHRRHPRVVALDRAGLHDVEGLATGDADVGVDEADFTYRAAHREALRDCGADGTSAKDRRPWTCALILDDGITSVR
jgi:hypothetical protein